MRKFKERMLSFILTFVMLVSLLTGMAPVEVSAADSQATAVKVWPEVIVSGTSMNISNNSSEKFYFNIKVATAELGWQPLPEEGFSLPRLNPSAEYYAYFCSETDYNDGSPAEECIHKVSFKAEQPKPLDWNTDISVNTTPGAIHITKNVNDEVYCKLRDSEGNEIEKWRYELASISNMTIGPLEAGEYYVDFFTESSYNYGRPTVEYDHRVLITVTEAGLKEGSLDAEKNEYIIDYKDGENVNVAVALNHPNGGKGLAKYYTQDDYTQEKIRWYKLPDDQDVEIVVTNSDSSVAPQSFICVEERDYVDGEILFDFNVTFRNVSIGDPNSTEPLVMLGVGKTVLTIDGDVYTGLVYQGGDLEVVGNGNNDTYRTSGISMQGSDTSLIVSDIKNVYIGSSEKTGTLNITDGPLTLLNIKNLSVYKGYNPVYSSHDMTFKNVSNFSITGESLCVFVGKYENGKLTFENSFGSITRIDESENGKAIESENGIFIILDEVTEIKSGADAETATAITLNGDNSVNKDTIGKYFEIVGETEEEPPAHNHNMVTKYDENGHWTECDGSDCTEKTASVPHVYDNDTDTTCDCGYTREVTQPSHNHNMVTKYDENGHWTECNGSDCTEKTASEPHVDANTDNKCDICEYVKEVVVTAPVITKQPQNVSVKVDEKATFSVTATGDNLKYQWQINRNDGKGFVNISGATSASYVTSAVDMSCNGFKYQCIVSNEGGNVTSNSATLTVTEKEATHTHSLTKVAEKAATCTTAGNKAYYTCSGCDSLYADAEGTTVTTLEAVTVKALGHDMTEATCTEEAVCQRTGCDHTEDELGHDWSGEWTIIKEATATEDGKKETLCTRGCGQKKVAIIPATGTTDDNGNLEKDAEVEPDAPIDEATLNNSKEELLEVGNIFTNAEKTQIANGTDARVWLEISKTDESAIASTDKAKIEQEAAKNMGNNPTITYFDVDLFKQVGSGAKQEITEPGIAMKITIVIPDELLKTDKKVSREYKIIRLHEGQVDVINGTFDSTTGEFTFETDKFSTYAIVYKDVPVNDDDDNSTPGDTDVIKPEDDKKDEVPKTGDSNTTLYSFILMLLSGLGIIICSGKKKLLNKES